MSEGKIDCVVELNDVNLIFVPYSGSISTPASALYYDFDFSMMF